MTDSRDWESDPAPRSARRLRRSVVRGGAETDPTDPEVPDAKRRGAQRRRQAVVVGVIAVAGLFVIALVLLYRMGRQVTDAEAETKGADIRPAGDAGYCAGYHYSDGHDVG